MLYPASRHLSWPWKNSGLQENFNSKIKYKLTMRLTTRHGRELNQSYSKTQQSLQSALHIVKSPRYKLVGFSQNLMADSPEL